MKKIWILMTTLMAVMLITAASAGALTDSYDAQRSVLFDMPNVTLRLQASFSLDGTEFKQMSITHVQQGMMSVRDVTMHTPKATGGYRNSGYTVLTDGEMIYANHMDGESETYYAERAKYSVAGKRTALDAIMDVARIAVETVEQLGGVQIDATTADGFTCIRASIGEEAVSPLLNGVVSLLFPYVAGRYQKLDVYALPQETQATIEDYVTTWEGIVYSTSSLSVQGGEVAVTLDELSRLVEVTGSADLKLKEKNGTERLLHVTVTEQVTDIGTSVITMAFPGTVDCECP